MSDEFKTQTDISFEIDPKDPLSTSEMKTALDNAESELGGIDEEKTSDEQLERFENGELAVSIFDDLLSAITELNNGFGEWSTADSYFNNDRNSDAAEQMETAVEHFREAKSTTNTARDSWGGLDSQHFKESNVELATNGDDLEHLEEASDAFARASETLVDMYYGMESLAEGAEYIDQERFGPAKNAFRDSSQSFEQANKHLRDAETAVPHAFRSEFIDATCETDSLVEASDLMGDGSEAAVAGNYNLASDYFDEANTALDTSCGDTL